MEMFIANQSSNATEGAKHPQHFKTFYVLFLLSHTLNMARNIAPLALSFFLHFHERDSQINVDPAVDTSFNFRECSD
jgi:hypothetical protein